MVEVANGQSTKIIIPSELQNIASLATIFNETKNRPLYLVDEYNGEKEKNEN